MREDHSRDQAVGCLLAGAAGDALGAAVEFSSWPEIVQRFGEGGIRDLVDVHGHLGAVTDDTQMTLFTAEGLIRAATRHRVQRVCHLPGVVHHAYLRWLATQDGEVGTPGPHLDHLDGALVAERALWDRRAPSSASLSSLRTGAMGAVNHPINDSKGSGALQRTVPVGFVGARRRFEVGADLAAITHGHPDGIFPAATLAVLVGALLDGAGLGPALDAAEEHLREPRAARTRAALQAGRALGETGPPTPGELDRLGGGWVAEEALAIAVACAVGNADRPERGIVAAVNHSGKSDTTGAVCGALLGALHGTQWLPPRWLDHLELSGVIARLADDAHHAFRVGIPRDPAGTVDPEWLERYPPW